MMTDEEFDLIDELYFVQPFSYLLDSLDWDESEILRVLAIVHQKGWVKCYRTPDDEIFEGADIVGSGTDYFFLASKEGLMKHNMA